MRIAVLAATSVAVLFSAPVAESAESIKPRCHAGSLRLKYHVNRDRAVSAYGRQAIGRDFRKTGSCHELGRSIRTFRRWLNQPGASATRHDQTPTRHRTSPRNTGGLYAIPAYIVWRESRGSYRAVNPSSGTFGAYQLQPFHFWRGGECAGLPTTPPGQDACAGILWERHGSSPWAETR